MICLRETIEFSFTHPGWKEDSIVGGQFSTVIGVRLMDFAVALALEGFLLFVHFLLQTSNTSVLHWQELSWPGGE